jgi:hypothetical protein
MEATEQKKKDWAENTKKNRLKRDYETALAKEQLEAIQQERKDQKFFNFRSQLDFSMHTALMTFVVWSAVMVMRYYGVV